MPMAAPLKLHNMSSCCPHILLCHAGSSKVESAWLLWLLAAKLVGASIGICLGSQVLHLAIFNIKKGLQRTQAPFQHVSRGLRLTGMFTTARKPCKVRQAAVQQLLQNRIRPCCSMPGCL